MTPWTPELPVSLLIFQLLIIAGLIFFARPYTLLLLALFTVVIRPGDWSLAGIRMDPIDLCFFGLVGALIVKPGSLPPIRRIPYLWAWVALGVLVSIAYVLAPMNARYLTDPVRTAYQLYRYCWKPMLLYPFVVLLIGADPRRRTHAVIAVIVAGVLLSLHASVQGYSDVDPAAYFSGGNSLGGALLAPFILALAGTLKGGTRRTFFLYLLATAAIARGLLFANSRGAFVATAAGVMAFLALMLTWHSGRRAVMQLSALGLVAVIALFATNPDLLQRPNVAHILTALQGSEDANFQWRVQERWPYFMEKIRENPWFGIGTNRDLELSDEANTPHNGYISLACIFGIPATVFVVTMGLLGALNGYRLSREQRSRDEKVLGVAVVGFVAGVLVHNIVDSIFLVTFVYNCYWLLTGLTVAAALRRPMPVVGQRAVSPIARRRAVQRRPLRPVLGQEAS